MQGSIAIKGTRNGLLLTLEPGTSFSDLLTALAERLAEAPSFFKGASLSLDTTRRTLEAGERTQLEDLLALYQMSVTTVTAVTAVVAPDALIASSIEDVPLLLAPDIPPTIARDEQVNGMAEAIGAASVLSDPRESSNTLFLRRTVRSGQAIKHASNVVVLGDVNHGAEIVAGGDIIVWGVVRGMVHAGYPDNEQALVCSLALAPVQLRIAQLLSRSPEGYEMQPRPEVAAIRNGQIVVEAWINGRSPRK